jgi:solute carrier family 25 phosphate transporter 23/24/25/41
MSLVDLNLNRTQQTMIAGGIAGSVSKTATAPLSRLTILYQVYSVKTGHESVKYNINESLYSVVRNVYQQEGLKSFWRGNLTAVIHRFPYSAVNFGVYDFLKKRILISTSLYSHFSRSIAL